MIKSKFMKLFVDNHWIISRKALWKLLPIIVFSVLSDKTVALVKLKIYRVAKISGY